MFCHWNDPNTIWTPVLMAWPWFQSYRNMYPPRFFHSTTEKQVVNIISILLMKHTPSSAAEIPLNQPIWCQKFHLYGYSSIKAFSGTVKLSILYYEKMVTPFTSKFQNLFNGKMLSSVMWQDHFILVLPFVFSSQLQVHWEPLQWYKM